MAYKKGFTLAEILVVLAVIGIIAMLTIPILTLYMKDAVFKFGYKKVYNGIFTLFQREHLASRLPVSGGANNVASIFEILAQNLQVNSFAAQKAENADDGNLFSRADFKYALTYTSSFGSAKTVGSGESLDATGDWQNSLSPWIVTDDNMAYSVIGGASGNCLTKERLNSLSGDDIASQLAQNSCAVIVVDVNGLQRGPNRVENQVKNGLDEGIEPSLLSGDRFYIYIGSDGASAGPKAKTLMGRIVSGMVQ